MCGIVGYVGPQDGTDVLIDGLRKLEYRGYDSAGVAVFQDGKIRVVKSKGRLDDVEKKMREVGRPSGHCGIGHTRWATHGAPSDKNSHPHGTDRVEIVHNGIIENYMELKAFLISKGYLFDSETDTETVAKLLDFYYDGDPFEAIRKTLADVRGAYALGILFADFPERIYAVRKDSPLIVGIGQGENFIASDIPAILKYTKDYYLIGENEIVTLEKDKIDIRKLDGTPAAKEKMTATWSVEAAEKEGYPHFMLKEIHEEPKAVRSTIAPRIQTGLPVFENISDDFLCGFKRLHIVACGTAYHAGLIGKYAIERLARIPVDVDLASEFRYRDPILDPKEDLTLFITQSGETADTLAAMRLAKSRGIPTLAVANVVGSTIPREADHVIYTWAGPEIAVASTKAYEVQVSVMYMLAIRLGFLRGTLPEAEARELTAALGRMPEALEEVIAQAAQFILVAGFCKDSEDIFYIGRGFDYPMAMEGSLKLKEISYIHSEAYAAAELKHGTISLVTEGVPVIAIAMQGDLYEKMVSNIREVKARGAMVVMLCGEQAGDVSGLADHVIRMPKLPDILQAMPVMTFMQMFAYYVAVLRRCDVDKPRNLAKSVTVE